MGCCACGERRECEGVCWRGRERERWGLTYVEGFEVFANFGYKLFTALVALRETFIWSIGLGEGKQGEGGASEGEEMANVLWEWVACVVMLELSG